MSDIFKKIRRYAKLRNIEYSKLKAVFLRATPEEKIIYKQEMINAAHNFPPSLKNDGPNIK